MLQCHSIISNYVTWDIGKGEEALSWEDSWDELSPVENFNMPTHIKNTLIQIWGKQVKDYKQVKMENGEEAWTWKSLEGTNLSLEEK